MKHILTESSYEDIGSDNNNINLAVFDENNVCGTWANDIYIKILDQLIDNGDRVNAHFYPIFINRLMRDMKRFPL